MLRLEKRPNPSRFWLYATPAVAVALTMFVGGLLFALMGKNPFEVIRTIFWDPVFGEFAFYLRGQLLVKAGPLILIAIGLALGFRAGIWNIGAEGQYIMGAIFGASVGLAVFPTESRWIFPVMVIAGAFGGWLWAMIPAILKTRFNTNEILVSLMLVYVAETILAKASTGFLKNPEGMGFPGSRNFSSYPAAQNSYLYEPLGLHWGGVAALVTGLLWFLGLKSSDEELEGERARETTLRADYRSKLQKAVSLEELKKQRAQVLQYVNLLEKQLPSKSEMDALLSDINQAGLGRSLQFDLFRSGQPVIRDYYAELPIALKVTGQYHDIGAFTSDIANLPRIVTLNNLAVNPSTDKDRTGSLVLEATVKTFRYLDPEEIAAQRKAVAKPGAKG